MILCEDVDLLMFEPALLRNCLLMATEVLLATLSVSGATVTSTVVDWSMNAVRPRMVAFRLDNRMSGVVTAMRAEGDGFWCVRPRPGQRDGGYSYGDVDANETGLGNAASTFVGVYTFPQAEPASLELIRDLGIESLVYPGQFDTTALRRAATLRTLGMIFRSMSALDQTVVPVPEVAGLALTYNGRYEALADWYDKAYERERRRLKVWVDEAVDGRADRVLTPAVLNPSRS